MKNIYKELPNQLPKIFEPHTQMKVKDLSEVNIEALLQETFTVTSIPTDKTKQDGQSTTVRILGRASSVDLSNTNGFA